MTITTTITDPPEHGTATPVPGQSVVIYQSAADYLGDDSYGYSIDQGDGSAPVTGTFKLKVVEAATFEVHSLAGTTLTPTDDPSVLIVPNGGLTTAFPLANDGITDEGAFVVTVEQQPSVGSGASALFSIGAYGPDHAGWMVQYGSPYQALAQPVDVVYGVYRNLGTVDNFKIGPLLYHRTIHFVPDPQNPGGMPPPKLVLTAAWNATTDAADFTATVTHLTNPYPLTDVTLSLLGKSIVVHTSVEPFGHLIQFSLAVADGASTVDENVTFGDYVPLADPVSFGFSIARAEFGSTTGPVTVGVAAHQYLGEMDPASTTQLTLTIPAA